MIVDLQPVTNPILVAALAKIIPRAIDEFLGDGFIIRELEREVPGFPPAFEFAVRNRIRSILMKRRTELLPVIRTARWIEDGWEGAMHGIRASVSELQDILLNDTYDRGAGIFVLTVRLPDHYTRKSYGRRGFAAASLDATPGERSASRDFRRAVHTAAEKFGCRADRWDDEMNIRTRWTATS